MKNPGQNNYKGINAQSWAAMSLFLQFLRDQKFSYISLESSGFQDFNIVFGDGRKIICESKNRKRNFTYKNLKEIFNNKNITKALKGTDELLIICKNADENLVSEIKSVQYFKGLKDKFKGKGFTNSEIKLLAKVRFWIVPPEFNENIIYSLFSDLINFWLPSDEIEKIVDNILVQKIYKGSARGNTYARKDILSEIESLAAYAKKNSAYYNDDYKKRNQQFVELNKALKNPKHGMWNIDKELSAFSTRYELLEFAKTRLVSKHNSLSLKNWDPIFKLNKIYYFTFGIFDIFENNIHTEANIKYVIEYIKKYTKTIRGFYRSDFFDVDVIKIITKIIEGKNGKKYLNDAFIVVKDLLTFDGQQFFYLKDNGYDYGKWEKEEICKLLHRIYNVGNCKIEEKTLTLITNVFNIIEDDGQFSHYSPKEVFDIFIDWINKGTKKKDFLNRFERLVKEVINQYDKFYKTYSKNISFDGWEHSGGGISFSGSHRVYDRHFVNVFTLSLIHISEPTRPY